MASLIYTSFIRDCVVGNIDVDADTFKMMLVTSSYTADKDHDFRNDITNEVTGTGYTTGGAAITPTVASVDTVGDDVEISWSSPSWSSSTITARAGVIYKSRGGASSADNLVAYVDFGSDISSTGGTFTVTVSTPIKFQN